MRKLSLAVGTLNRLAGECATWGDPRETFGLNKLRESTDLSRDGALRLRDAGYGVTRNLRTGAYRVAQ